MTNNYLPQWRQELKASQFKEGKLSSNRWIQLANISINNQPRVRTVVFRGWLDSNTMLIYTDKRSEKFKDLEINNNIEILWLFYKCKSQYRFKGEAFFIDKNDQYWNKLSQRTKMPWFWPCPKERIDKTQTFPSSNKILSKPSNFCVLEIKIKNVELLKLENPIHKRYIWDKNNNWDRIEVYP